ncbi:hypothetical protein AB0I39_13980 [Kitasatospora purpeofusca]|uniref:hypothetical protein n=1 Tax=Kitasatospora purpeofusca TaxID=67352 RepID=UPI0033D37694
MPTTKPKTCPVPSLKEEVDAKNTGFLDRVRPGGIEGRPHAARAKATVDPATGRDERDGPPGG